MFACLEPSYFLEHNLAWILALVGTPLGWILVVYLYEKYKHHIDYTREIIRQYIFFIIVTGIFSLIFFSPEKIIFHDERLCKGNTCYPYSSIKSINLDKSGYNVQLIFKPFDTTIEFSVPQKDMLVSKMSDGDEEHVSSFLVHSPILNINDRISYVISEYESNLDDDFTVEQISFFSEQKNFEKTLDAIISGKIKYPETLEHDWIATLNILHKKTGLFPQVIDF